MVYPAVLSLLLVDIHNGNADSGCLRESWGVAQEETKCFLAVEETPTHQDGLPFAQKDARNLFSDTKHGKGHDDSNCPNWARYAFATQSDKAW